MTNTEYLMIALGVQGGTIHQVASATFLDVLTILDLDKFKLYNGAAYGYGYEDARGECLTIPVSFSRNSLISYWQGVIAGVKDNLS